MAELYSVSKLLESMIADYQLPMDGENDKKTYQTQMYRALHGTGIWDHAIIRENGKKKMRFFSEQQKQKLFGSEMLYDYLRDRSGSEYYRNSKRYHEIQKEIQKRREAHIAYLDSRRVEDYEDDNAPFISEQELQTHKNNMMLQALFEHFFTPFDTDLLKNDLYTMLYKDELDLDTPDLQAEERLEHPEGSYYHRKEKA